LAIVMRQRRCSDRAAEQHEPWIVIYGRSAPYDGLRKDPRLAALFAKIEAPD